MLQVVCPSALQTGFMGLMSLTIELLPSKPNGKVNSIRHYDKLIWRIVSRITRFVEIVLIGRRPAGQIRGEAMLIW